MKMRPFRRGCGLAFGLILWGVPAGAEEAAEPSPLKAAPALIELDAAAELDGKLLATERVQDRHPNRTLKTERVVAQDESGNYFNHGTCVAWDEEGRMSGRGEYRYNKREGKWTRWFTTAETEAKYAALLELGFQAPFTSQADFEADEIHGAWTIVDAKQRPVAAWEFDHGVRHGLSAWYYPDGKKFREVEYHNGDLDGMVREYTPQQKLAKEEKFVEGFRIGVQVEYYDSGELKSECEMLFAKLSVTSVDDWWNGTTEIHTSGRIGHDQRHGKYQAWDREGHLILAGSYVDDAPNGKFIWWFSNGNKAIEGGYTDGKQDGLWTWYHENGLKEIVGEYAMGHEAGRWLMWADDGRVAETMSIHGGVSADPTITGKLHTGKPQQLEAPPIPQVSPATAVETTTPSPEPVRRVTFEQLTIQKSTPIEAQATEAETTEANVLEATLAEIPVESDPTESVVIEQDGAALAPAAKTILKPVAQRPEAGQEGS